MKAIFFIILAIFGLVKQALATALVLYGLYLLGVVPKITLFGVVLVWAGYIFLTLKIKYDLKY